MKVLIVTQNVDAKDPILGFFHRWLEEFGRQCGKVTVIGQHVAGHQLPANVVVQSLEKEKGRRTFSQILRFWKLQWKLRGDYDAVLVHMTPVWIVLGAPLWIILRKRMYLWYEARGTRWPLRVALLFVQKVFSASEHGMPLSSKKSVVVGHGIDTDFFSPGKSQRKARSLITVGRITASKHLDLILREFLKLPKDYTLTIVGHAITSADKKLEADLRGQISVDGLEDRVTIRSATQEEVRDLLRQSTVFVHASETSLDKAPLEAASTDTAIVSTAVALLPFLSPECRATPDTLGARIQEFCEHDTHEQRDIVSGIRELVRKEHSLERLVGRLVEEMDVR